MNDQLSELNDHIIVCGAGETSQHIIQSLQKNNVPFVVIEFEEDKLVAIKEYDNVIAFHGDATQDEALEKAGIYRAKGLIAALNSDANNLYTVLTARQIKPDLLIVARATHTILTTSLFELAQKRPFLQTRSVGIGWLLC